MISRTKYVKIPLNKLQDYTRLIIGEVAIQFDGRQSVLELLKCLWIVCQLCLEVHVNKYGEAVLQSESFVCGLGSMSLVLFCVLLCCSDMPCFFSVSLDAGSVGYII